MPRARVSGMAATMPLARMMVMKSGRVPRMLRSTVPTPMLTKPAVQASKPGYVFRAREK